ncbi:membrane protein [Microlunatus endophyticus]|uniref:Membrane protein n=1 Tax=Microlunatus endophyticus TaxID=1716077 RepID=A0A917S2L3_9ACTN|nr:glycosyltransferase 87 family protein [Microlunatus endophyticus]GGL49980.1 membrane protein [Microlunatus endophyticus]
MATTDQLVAPPPMTTAQRFRRMVGEMVPAYVVSLIMLPLIIAGGRYWPFRPSTMDLQVYFYAVRAMLHGANIMEWTSPGFHLWFIYPPAAAIVMLPLAIGPFIVWELLWIAGLVIAQNVVMIRCGVPRGLPLALFSIALVIGMEPIRTTIGYAQINTFLMVLVVIDLLPSDPRRKRRFPAGILIGLAAAIKLTPAIFVLMLLIVGKKKQALTAIITFAVLTAIGTAVQPAATVSYLKSLAGGDTHTSGPVYVGNQSLLGVVLRLFGDSHLHTYIGLLISVIVAVIAAIVGAHWWKQGAHVLAIGFVGLGSNLASPLSWTHHFVWILPLAIAVLYQLRRRPWPDARADHVPMPRWLLIASGAIVLYVSACLPLALLPYYAGAADHYNALQELIANFGPILITLVLIVAAGGMIVRSRRVSANGRTDAEQLIEQG